MDIEFHYYMTHMIALRAGFAPEAAYTLAYASQYTDDNDEVYRIEGRDAFYENLISQTMDTTKPQEECLSIYPVFHFCPAPVREIFKEAPPRRDGTYHLLDTLPGNRNARKIFTSAMKSGDLYRIGIGTLEDADIIMWKEAGRTDILERVVSIPIGDSFIHDVWFSPITGEEVQRCPWLRKLPRKDKYNCRIHDLKPRLCSEYPKSKEHAERTGCSGFD